MSQLEFSFMTDDKSSEHTINNDPHYSKQFKVQFLMDDMLAPHSPTLCMGFTGYRLDQMLANYMRFLNGMGFNVDSLAAFNKDEEIIGHSDGEFEQ